MADSFSLPLLGPPEPAVGGRPVRIRSAKTRALLCCLATTPGARSRAEPAGLLWGERPDANARGSLRLALSELRKDVGGRLDITRDHVGFRADDGCFVDYWQLTRDPMVAGALRLRRGEFLDGLSFGDAPAFAGWLECERRRARLVATSRRRLDVPGQVIVPVEGLAEPAAEALFAARALRARPEFDPEREAPLVAAICAATGGLPLAIELAAGLLRAVPCADLAERLGVDTGLLCTAGPAARPRHASMRTVFETSWRLLDPASRTIQELRLLTIPVTADPRDHRPPGPARRTPRGRRVPYLGDLPSGPRHRLGEASRGAVRVRELTAVPPWKVTPRGRWS